MIRSIVVLITCKCNTIISNGDRSLALRTPPAVAETNVCVKSPVVETPTLHVNVEALVTVT